MLFETHVDDSPRKPRISTREASDGRMDAQSLYSVVAHNRFIEDLNDKAWTHQRLLPGSSWESPRVPVRVALRLFYQKCGVKPVRFEGTT